MLFNKNNYRKAGEKKVLHKVGKEWKVVSVALLMAIAGGAVAATHANANADANTNAVDNTVNQLNSSAVANPPRYAAPSSTVSSSANKSVASSAIHYYTDANNGFSGYNGIAASYFDQVSDENKVVQKNYNTVNSYVQSLNAEYNPQMHSYGVKIDSASDAAKNDSKLAKSYSATTRNNATFATINSLAAKNSLDPTAYQGAVENNERYYSGAVSGASADAKAASDVNSLVSKLEGTNLSDASLRASVAAGVAHSNLNGANSVSASISAEMPGAVHNNTSLATRLAADAEVLSAAGNEIGNNADYQSLMNNNRTNVPAQNSLTNDINKAVSSAVNSASSNVAADLSSLNNATRSNNLNDIAANANSNGYFLSNVTDENSVSLSYAGDNTGVAFTGDSMFRGAVSAATDYSLAGVLSNAADDLLGHGNAAYNAAYAKSVALTSASTSASAKARYASYAYNVAAANSNMIQSMSNSVGNGSGSDSNALASYAASLLNSGLTSFDVKFGYLKSSNSASFGTQISNSTDYFTALGSVMGTNSSAGASLASNDVYNGTTFSITSATDTTVGNNTATTEASVANTLTSVANVVSEVGNVVNSAMKDTTYTGKTIDGLSATSLDADFTSSNPDANDGLKSGAIANILDNATDTKMAASNVRSAASSAINDYNHAGFAQASIESGASLSAFSNAISTVYTELNAAAKSASSVSGSTDHSNGLYSKETPSLTSGDNQVNVQAALLSDGVDIVALNDESDAIANVNSTAKSAVQSASNVSGFSGASSAENLANALSVAASSADSALGSANTASANYSAANDEDVTLASYFASSYTNEANSESASAVDLNNDLSSYLVNMASDSAFTNADSAYNAANYAAANDYKLGVGYAQAIYNSHAHFLDVLKNAKLHSTPDFGSKNYNDKVVGSVNKGDRLTVLGVNVSRNNDWRGVVRYAVLDNSNGKKGFITGQPAYTKAAYLSAIAAHSDVNIKTLKPVNVYATEDSKKVLKTIPAGQELDNSDVVYASAEEDAYGFTKVQLSNGNFITANTDYVEILNPTVNTPTNNTPSEFGFNLNGGQNMAPYYNNLTQN